MKSKFLILKTGIYPRDVVLTRAKAEEIDLFLRRRSVHLTDTEIEKFEEHYEDGARTVRPCSGRYIIIQFFCGGVKLPILIHELFHATTMILEDIGLRLTDDSDEAYAYLLERLTEQALRFI